MYRPNFCVECGERLTSHGWRRWLSSRFCSECVQRIGRGHWLKPIAVIVLIAASGFAAGRFLRPPPPPLIIQRAANSPLWDLSLDGARTTSRKENPAGPGSMTSSVDEPGYICGARTRKGTPCHRRVHVPGERCFQHKGLAAMVALDKLVVKSK